MLQRLADMTAAAGAWLVCDDTYESFLYSGKPHVAINAPHVVHIFSFSKASPGYTPCTCICTMHLRLHLQLQS